ncbi:MAG: nucleotide exchange factor GrpE [Patescibacteria group bacterium]|nr:nucleotide exchange factor GrpE [Patescibacteria group bacterium]
MEEQTQKQTTTGSENQAPPESSSASQTDNTNTLQRERDEYLDGWKRAKADLANYKKEETKRFESVLKFSNEQIIRDLLIVLDSFDLAIAARGGESKEEKGTFLIRAQLEDVLKRYGLERVVVSVGQPFDPALQEAIASIESTQASGTVVEEVERGYTLAGKLIRPARVKVAK